MFSAEYLNETHSSTFSALNPRKRRLKSLIPKNIKAFPQDFFEINQSLNAPHILSSRASPESEENTQRHSFPLDPIPLPRNSYFFHQNLIKKELQNISSQPMFRIRDRIILAPIFNDGKSSDRTHLVSRKLEEESQTARGLYSGSTDQMTHRINENLKPRNPQFLDIKPHGPASLKPFFTESANYSYSNQSKSTEKSFSIPGFSIIEQDMDHLESPRTRQNDDDDADCKTPGFKHIENGLSTKREKKAASRKEEVYTFAQNSPKEQEVKSIKLGSNSSKNKLNFNKFMLSKPRNRLFPISQKENKENINIVRKPPKIQTKKPSFRVLPSLKKALA